ARTTRSSHSPNHTTATLLNSRKVLVEGRDNSSYLSSAELYDPATGSWVTTGSLVTARYNHTATLLPNGKVLVAGRGGVNRIETEVYDPATGRWSNTGSLSVSRESHTATLLPSGRVLVAGGLGRGGRLDSGEWFE